MWEDTVFFNTCFEYALFSNQQFFDFLFNGDDLRLDLGSLVLGYTSGDDQLANTTGTFKSLLGLDKNVRNILVFTQQGNVKKNFQRFGVRCQNNKFSLATVQSFCSFVGTLFQ